MFVCRKTSIWNANSIACIQILGEERVTQPINHFSAELIMKIALSLNWENNFGLHVKIIGFLLKIIWKFIFDIYESINQQNKKMQLKINHEEGAKCHTTILSYSFSIFHMAYT